MAIVAVVSNKLGQHFLGKKGPMWDEKKNVYLSKKRKILLFDINVMVLLPPLDFLFLEIAFSFRHKQLKARINFEENQ